MNHLETSTTARQEQPLVLAKGNSFVWQVIIKPTEPTQKGRIRAWFAAFLELGEELHTGTNLGIKSRLEAELTIIVENLS